jgi:hypothetical protein
MVGGLVSTDEGYVRGFENRTAARTSRPLPSAPGSPAPVATTRSSASAGLRGALARPGALPRVRAHAREPPDARAGRLGRRRARSQPPTASTGGPWCTFQGGIHAGEIDGKDAGFVALRELLEGRVSPGALERTTVLFVPVLNVDGHERFGAWNRPNQRGPEEMGWRTTAQNLNLNRDHAKADAPEMRALLGLLNAWDPILYADLHVTNGAELREDLSVEVEPGDGWDLELGLTGHALRDEVLARLRRAGFHALPFYPAVRRQRRAGIGLRGVGLAAPLQPELLGDAQPLRRARRNALLAALSAARGGDARDDPRDGGPRRARRCEVARIGPRRRRARTRAGRHARRAQLHQHGRRAHGGHPRLRVHAGAVHRFRPDVDPLRLDASHDRGSCRSGTK